MLRDRAEALRDHYVERPPTAERLSDHSVNEVNGPSANKVSGPSVNEVNGLNNETVPKKNNTMHNYNNLQIWQQAMDLVEEIYKLTASFPIEEKFGLVSQMTRAAVSIPSNIAEGAGRNSDKDFAHFISIAIGSLYELNTQIVLSERLGYINQSQSQELQKKLDNLQRKSVSFKSKLNI